MIWFIKVHFSSDAALIWNKYPESFKSTEALNHIKSRIKNGFVSSEMCYLNIMNLISIQFYIFMNCFIYFSNIIISFQLFIVILIIICYQEATDMYFSFLFWCSIQHVIVLTLYRTSFLPNLPHLWLFKNNVLNTYKLAILKE